MTHVLTLIGAPGTSGPDQALPDRMRRELEAAGAACGEIEWLSRGEACDLRFTGLPQEPAYQAIRHLLNGSPLDWCVQPSSGRRKGLLVADMESTIIGQEMLDELAELAGVGDEIVAITARSMAGELDFETSLKERVALLSGLSCSALEKVSSRMHLNPGAATLVATLRKHGAYCALVSGGFTYFADQIRDRCGFDEARANCLEHQGGTLTGRVAEPVLDREAKLLALKELAAARHLDLQGTCAVGDGANDLAMITDAGLGVAYRGKPILRAAANFRIDHGDLTGPALRPGIPPGGIRREGLSQLSPSLTATQRNSPWL